MRHSLPQPAYAPPDALVCWASTIDIEASQTARAAATLVCAPWRRLAGLAAPALPGAAGNSPRRSNLDVRTSDRSREKQSPDRIGAFEIHIVKVCIRWQSVIEARASDASISSRSRAIGEQIR
jgi:hypothetical protein